MKSNITVKEAYPNWFTLVVERYRTEVFKDDKAVKIERKESIGKLIRLRNVKERYKAWKTDFFQSFEAAGMQPTGRNME